MVKSNNLNHCLFEGFATHLPEFTRKWASSCASPSPSMPTTCRTKSRHEKIVRDQLANQGIEPLLPTVKRLSQWKDRRKEIEVPLFSGYCFVRFALERKLPVLKTIGVVDIVGAGPSPGADPGQRDCDDQDPDDPRTAL